MANIRILYDNAADRATLSASSTAGSLVAANMQGTIKSSVWRSTSTSATITATWTTAEVVAAVILPFCNLTSQATVRVRGYATTSSPTPLFDTGAVYACPAPALGLWGWGQPLGVNAFAYGGGTYGRVWVSNPAQVAKVVIDIVDTTNTAGYIEVSRLLIGDYWEPEVGPEAGSATMSVNDTSKHYRTDGGDQLTDVGTKYRKQSFSLPWLASASDKAKMWNILWGNGMARPVFISMYPNNSDVTLEQANQLYGKLVTSPVMSTPYFNRNSATLDIEEV